VHSDTPVPLLISGGKVTDEKVDNFSERNCERGILGILERGCELMPKLMELLKK
jgi:2,3-bisphosphoglycerate-independent phosphoglycerate mutase